MDSRKKQYEKNLLLAESGAAIASLSVTEIALEILNTRYAVKIATIKEGNLHIGAIQRKRGLGQENTPRPIGTIQKPWNESVRMKLHETNIAEHIQILGKKVISREFLVSRWNGMTKNLKNKMAIVRYAKRLSLTRVLRAWQLTTITSIALNQEDAKIVYGDCFALPVISW
jgi:hypothetical protein